MALFFIGVTQFCKKLGDSARRVFVKKSPAASLATQAPSNVISFYCCPFRWTFKVQENNGCAKTVFNIMENCIDFEIFIIKDYRIWKY